ncbi:MAG: YcgL domain-containing protein [Gammaproteobacteria bacterium]|nr:YcgL domain-containing protein [Gammaproteobacteria bacterium]
MECFVYRSLKKNNTYLYIVEKDDFSNIPSSLMTVFGSGEFSLSFEHSPDKKLAQEDSRQVYENLTTQGFHLQLPNEDYLYEL